MLKGTRLTKEAYRKAFGDVPRLPRHAFDPNRRSELISYHSWDGLAARSCGWEAWLFGKDGAWHETNAADVATKAALLTKEQYHRMFGPLPPLPPAAFRS
jgi:hypothetical protein